MVNPVLVGIKWALDQVPKIERAKHPERSQREAQAGIVSDISRLIFRVGVLGIPMGGFTIGNRYAIRPRPPPRARVEEAFIPRGAPIESQGTDDLIPRIEADDIIPIVGYHI